jgi:hypothetical protein
MYEWLYCTREYRSPGPLLRDTGLLRGIGKRDSGEGISSQGFVSDNGVV